MGVLGGWLRSLLGWRVEGEGGVGVGRVVGVLDMG